MKFSEFEAETWLELREYFDTCLIPVTGLNGAEAPHEATARLEQLREVMDWIETPFQGRIVTYPAIQYGGTEIAGFINIICSNLKQSGFHYVIVASLNGDLTSADLPEASLVVTPSLYPIDGQNRKGKNLAVEEQIYRLWQEHLAD